MLKHVEVGKVGGRERSSRRHLSVINQSYKLYLSRDVTSANSCRAFEKIDLKGSKLKSFLYSCLDLMTVYIFYALMV